MVESGKRSPGWLGWLGSVGTVLAGGALGVASGGASAATFGAAFGAALAAALAAAFAAAFAVAFCFFPTSFSASLLAFCIAFSANSFPFAAAFALTFSSFLSDSYLLFFPGERFDALGGGRIVLLVGVLETRVLGALPIGVKSSRVSLLRKLVITGARRHVYIMGYVGGGDNGAMPSGASLLLPCWNFCDWGYVSAIRPRCP